MTLNNRKFYDEYRANGGYLKYLTLIIILAKRLTQIAIVLIPLLSGAARVQADGLKFQKSVTLPQPLSGGGLAVDKSGNIYTSDREEWDIKKYPDGSPPVRLLKYSPELEIVNSYTFPTEPGASIGIFAIEPDAKGNVFILFISKAIAPHGGGGGYILYKLDPSLKPVSSIQIISGSSEWVSATGLTIDDHGNVYVAYTDKYAGENNICSEKYGATSCLYEKYAIIKKFDNSLKEITSTNIVRPRDVLASNLKVHDNKLFVRVYNMFTNGDSIVGAGAYSLDLKPSFSLAPVQGKKGFLVPVDFTFDKKGNVYVFATDPWEHAVYNGPHLDFTSKVYNIWITKYDSSYKLLKTNVIKLADKINELKNSEYPGIATWGRVVPGNNGNFYVSGLISIFVNRTNPRVVAPKPDPRENTPPFVGAGQSFIAEIDPTLEFVSYSIISDHIDPEHLGNSTWNLGGMFVSGKCDILIKSGRIIFSYSKERRSGKWENYLTKYSTCSDNQNQPAQSTSTTNQESQPTITPTVVSSPSPTSTPPPPTATAEPTRSPTSTPPPPTATAEPTRSPTITPPPPTAILNTTPTPTTRPSPTPTTRPSPTPTVPGTSFEDLYGIGPGGPTRNPAQADSRTTGSANRNLATLPQPTTALAGGSAANELSSIITLNSAQVYYARSESDSDLLFVTYSQTTSSPTYVTMPSADTIIQGSPGFSASDTNRTQFRYLNTFLQEIKPGSSIRLCTGDYSVCSNTVTVEKASELKVTKTGDTATVQKKPPNLIQSSIDAIGNFFNSVFSFVSSLFQGKKN